MEQSWTIQSKRFGYSGIQTLKVGVNWAILFLIPFLFIVGSANAQVCDRPQNLSIKNLTSNSVKLHWEEDVDRFYDVEYGTAGFTHGSGTLITGIQGNYTTITGLSSTLEYAFYVRMDCGTEGNSAWAGPFKFRTVPCDVDSATGSAYSACGFSKVQSLGGTDNFTNSIDSVGPPPTYLDFSDIKVSQVEGDVFQLMLDPRGSASRLSMGVWVDWNRNNIFDANELVHQNDNVYVSNGSHLVTISIPSDQREGDYKMRIAIKIYSPSESIASCGTLGSGLTNQYGEAQDYTINVINSIHDCNGVPNLDSLTSSSTLVCPGKSFGLSAYFTENQWDVTGQWQSSIHGLNDWNSILGAKGVYLNVGAGIAENTDYRYIATCQNTGDKDTASITINLKDISDCYCVPGTSALVPVRYLSSFLTQGAETNINYHGTTKGYIDKTTDTISLIPGYGFDFSASINGVGSTLAIWVDFDNNGIFDANELIFSEFLNSGLHDGRIDIDSSRAAGIHRVRVMGVYGNYSTSINPCNTYQGSTLDFILKIQPALLCYPTSLPVLDSFGFTFAGFSWEGQGDDFEVEWGSAGFAHGQGQIQTVTGKNVLLNGLVKATNYDAYVRQNCGTDGYSDWNGPVSFYTDYCKIWGSSNPSSSHFISRVVTHLGFENIDNSSASNSYTDFSDQYVSQIPGDSVNISIEGYTGAMAVSIWIDWNNNLIFEDEEQVFLSDELSKNVSNIALKVPVNQPIGEYRMRIVATNYLYTALDFPNCGGNTYLEAHDYTFKVLPALTACNDKPTAGLITSSELVVCPELPFELFGSEPTVGDLTYRWQASEDGVSWADIPGALARNYNIEEGISMTTKYRAIVTCPNTQQSDTSQTLEITVKDIEDCFCIPEPSNSHRGFVADFHTANAAQNLHYTGNTEGYLDQTIDTLKIPAHSPGQ